MEIPQEFERLFDVDWREAAVFGGRFCLSGDTVVSMWDGSYKTIDSVVVGETVLSKEGEPDIIVDIQKFAAEFDPKPIIKLNINGTITTTTYDHKYFNGREYVPIYQLVWGIMAPSQRRTLELLCEQYGEVTHNELQGWLQNSGYEAGNQSHGLFNNSDWGQNKVSPSSDSQDIHTQSRKKGNSESQERNQDRQPSGEYGVGDSEGTVAALVGHWTEKGRSQNGQQFQKSNREGSQRVVAISFRESDNTNQNNGADTKGQDGFELRWDSGFVEWQNLDSSTSRIPVQKNDSLGGEEIRITVEDVTESLETYDITTQNHHNFFANGVNVSNSLKSHTVARYLLIQARMDKKRILCAREFQNSISESSHQLLADLITQYQLTDFVVTDKSIVNKVNGSDFLFKGLKHNEQSIKSIEGIDIAWVEEAQTISKESIEVLTPTVRKPGSKIIYTYNRLLEDDPVHQRLVIEGRPNTLIINVNYDIAEKYGMIPDVIKQEIEDDKANRPSLYKHKWLGEPSSMERKIYKDWKFIDAVPHEARLERYGLDFGYTNDPTAIVAVYYYNGGYILDEIAYQKGLSNKQIADILNGVPKAPVIADSAEPKSIDEIRAYGVTILPTVKGNDSVKQGIQFVQRQRISVTNRSFNIINEYKRYMWMEDKDGKIINKPEHQWSHSMDSIRYSFDGLQPREDDVKRIMRMHMARRHNNNANAL